MPRFSVIVTTQGLAGRLPSALDSVLAQSFTDFELIPTCETSGSPAATVVEEYAERDPRVARLTGSRNAATRAATGTYLLFLNASDVLTPRALTAMDARLRETGEVDVLYLAHERVPWWVGEQVTHPCDDAGPSDVRRPVWATAYRRTFLADHRLAFPEGRFTDIGWSGR